MKNFMIGIIIVFIASSAFASDFGIYEQVVQNAKGSAEQVANQIAEALNGSHFVLLNKIELRTPDLVRQDDKKHSGFRAYLVLATAPSFDSLVANYGNRYAANWLLRIGVYQDENGTQVQIANPETITRIICNDLSPENYETVVNAAKVVKEDFRKIITSAVAGTAVDVQMPPIRSEEALRKAHKDMIMMVGPMTYFKSEGQFLLLREEPIGNDAAATFHRVLAEVEQHIRNFQPTAEDANYHWCNNPELNLKWQVAATVKLTGVNAALIGITRGHTEALSFHICGMKREKATNLTPGLDHAAAYPIEVVVFEEQGKIKVGTAREMFRMDMYFWDAGKWAFMKFMSMPGILDKSIKNAITGIQQ